VIVADASVIVAALSDDLPHADWSAAVIRGSELLAPQAVLPETAGALRRLELRGRITAAQARRALGHLVRLPVQLNAFEPFVPRIWSLRANLTVHDAWYVALAEAFGAPLATLDRRLTRASGPTCEFLSPD
jgi:predicted nucleic acid-binding protein